MLGILGQLLYERRGRITDQRIMSIDNGIPKFEVSIAGTGVFTGSSEVKTNWTYRVIHRPDGTS
jgi:hypothetical protein